MSDITVWNSAGEIVSAAMKKEFFSVSCSPDDIDWICFVPNHKMEPMFCWESMVDRFKTPNGCFYIRYHA